MEIYKNEELRKQIVNDGGKWVGELQFWLFGTATYYDGTMISREKAEKDTRYFFNMLDRKLVKRIDYIENRKLDRLVFIEKGRTRTNTHIHFFIKGNDYVSYRELEEKCIELWNEKIQKRYDIKMLDNLYAGNRRNEYCLKEMTNLNANVFYPASSHINFT